MVVGRKARRILDGFHSFANFIDRKYRHGRYVFSELEVLRRAFKVKDHADIAEPVR